MGVPLQIRKLAVYVVGLAPAVALFWLGVDNQLGPEPIKELEQELGQWALRFLLAALAVTPLRRFVGVDLMRYRRALGLLAFYYAFLHLAAYVALDHGFDWAAVWADIVKRPYVTVGMASFAILLPLALTSNAAAIRRMGGKAWAKLHRLVYVAALAAAAHFVLIVKSWPAEPLIYAGLTVALLLSRLAPVRSRRGTLAL
ncbi:MULTISPECIES: protein-methionine-sulfoxide reductase heme-binding subunit MsrQ [Methylosinus]|uniref:Protein-methionine-sulfoxide reductase heme-binding subunit MsrQ n=1 Tax=Methylosinus trichosporium (strain ATCC 35070 / NCIMB 11131 / UNIQEM 75 / OB3b) TaxID=595536 RepID=A0A2D2D0R0_METT3|nr:MULTISPECIES: protein-methionine-sulfoxide reductase heme-binding subunit MsrQ [Methylosinus]ATQ68459.1 protein-methionine-sulfoxide reductase heme-binding subunit MsrQ [Methylosinus trichosporium OB3b]OBS51306.1 sulfoxide reductase heme-binding subunit YedZ [Methylosinus sp. 3S-1]